MIIKKIKIRRAERFVASLLASLSLGHITEDKRDRERYCYSPQIVAYATTSFIRKTLYQQ